MSKGWTRRPTNLSRAVFDAAWESCFGKNGSQESDSHIDENGVVTGESGEVARAEDEAHSEAKSRELTVRACRLAEVMEMGFGDQRSRA